MPIKLNTYIVVALAMVLAIIAGLGIWGSIQHKAYLEAKGAADLLSAQYKDAATKNEIEIAALHASSAASEIQKQAALDAAATERQLRVKADTERDAAIAKTKALPDDILSSAINLRIGAGESSPIASGVFTFTRPGVESTLNHFLAGETAETNLVSALAESAHKSDALDLCESQRGNLSAELKLTANERDLAKQGWDKEADALGHLERSIWGTRVKAFAWGAGAGAVAIVLLRIFKII
jgi:hypothetical protein